MGVREEEFDPTAREKHRAALRKQLLNITHSNVPEDVSVEQLQADIALFGHTPVKEKGRHRKPKK